MNMPVANEKQKRRLFLWLREWMVNRAHRAALLYGRHDNAPNDFVIIRRLLKVFAVTAIILGRNNLLSRL